MLSLTSHAKASDYRIAATGESALEVFARLSNHAPVSDHEAIVIKRLGHYTVLPDAQNSNGDTLIAIQRGGQIVTIQLVRSSQVNERHLRVNQITELEA